MRAVVDTNVLVSGVLSPHGPPGRVVDAMLANRFIVLFDDRTMAEYREVLFRPVFQFDVSEVEAILEHIERVGERVVYAPCGIVLPDASDLPFLEAAISGNADALVTGNLKHFKPTSGRHKVPIVSPAEFLVRLT
ncbi:MAG: putative toxin-antitoxin system toxin component, PIN family [Terriglobales bacterium]